MTYNTVTEDVTYDFVETELLSVGISAADFAAMQNLPATQTGTGAMVLATSPTLVTPVLGVAAATSIAIGGATAISSQTGTGGVAVMATSPTLVTPVLGVADATTINTGTGGHLVSGVKIIGAQAAAIADASGGATVDAEARTALNDLLAKLRTHGIIAT